MNNVSFIITTAVSICERRASVCEFVRELMQREQYVLVQQHSQGDNLDVL